MRSLPYLFAGMDFWSCSSRFCVQALFNIDGFSVVFALFHRAVLTSAVEYQHPTVFRVCYALLRRTRMYDLHLKLCHSVRRMLRHIQPRAVTPCKSDMFEIAPRWIYIRPLLHAVWNRWCLKSIPAHLFRFLCEKEGKFRMCNTRSLLSSMSNI